MNNKNQCIEIYNEISKYFICPEELAANLYFDNKGISYINRDIENFRYIYQSAGIQEWPYNKIKYFDNIIIKYIDFKLLENKSSPGVDHFILNKLLFVRLILQRVPKCIEIEELHNRLRFDEIMKLIGNFPKYDPSPSNLHYYPIVNTEILNKFKNRRKNRLPFTRVRKTMELNVNGELKTMTIKSIHIDETNNKELSNLQSILINEKENYIMLHLIKKRNDLYDNIDFVRKLQNGVYDQSFDIDDNTIKILNEDYIIIDNDDDDDDEKEENNNNIFTPHSQKRKSYCIEVINLDSDDESDDYDDNEGYLIIDEEEYDEDPMEICEDNSKENNNNISSTRLSSNNKFDIFLKKNNKLSYNEKYHNNNNNNNNINININNDIRKNIQQNCIFNTMNSLVKYNRII